MDVRSELLKISVALESFRRTAGPVKMSDFEIESILLGEGLQNLGTRYGKAGVFYGIKGGGRVISLGRRELLANALLVEVSHDSDLRNPGSRWNNEASMLKSQVDADKVRKWAIWAKGGPTSIELRELARQRYQESKLKPQDSPYPHYYGFAKGSEKR